MNGPQRALLAGLVRLCLAPRRPRRRTSAGRSGRSGATAAFASSFGDPTRLPGTAVAATPGGSGESGLSGGGGGSW